MHHRLAWTDELAAEYDTSTFDTDPFEPEPAGVRTIFPFWVPGPEGSGYVDLPYTVVLGSGVKPSIAAIKKPSRSR